MFFRLKVKIYKTLKPYLKKKNLRKKASLSSELLHFERLKISKIQQYFDS